jgi:transposase
MEQPPPPSPAFVGVDVAKDRLDVHLRPSGEAFAATRDGPGLDDLVARLRAAGPALVVLEATGGFEATVAAALAAAGLPLAVVNPRQIRHFAKAVGRLAKTDRLDAEVIALFAERVRPEARPLPDAAARGLAELVARRRQLVEMVTAEDNRRRQAREPRLVRRIEAHLDWLREALAETDADLGDGVRACPAWREREELLTSVPGVGGVTARTLLALLPELGALDRRKVAALAGLAPVCRDSGRRRGRREIAGGRGPLRAALYMAALVASRRNPVIAVACRRLRAAGKPAKLALTAVTRKLLTILNAIARDGRKWEQNA